MESITLKDFHSKTINLKTGNMYSFRNISDIFFFKENN